MTSVSIDVSLLDDSRRYMDASIPRCLCEGHYSDERTTRHLIWLAFTTNDPKIPLCSTLGLMSQAAALMGNTKITHCQLVFYDHRQQQFYTYSADKKNGVTCSYTKAFNRDGWRFIEIDVTEAQELTIRRYLIGQVFKPFDFAATLWLYFWPRRTSERAWFCSELMLTAMKRAGLAENGPAPWLTPPHRLYTYMKTAFIDTHSRELVAMRDGKQIFINPVSISNQLQSGSMKYAF